MCKDLGEYTRTADDLRSNAIKKKIIWDIRGTKRMMRKDEKYKNIDIPKAEDANMQEG